MVFGLKLGLPKKGGHAAAPAEPPPSSGPAPTQHAPPSGGGAGKKNAMTVNEFVSRTKKCREKGLEPTKPELIAYARYLGIDPVVDGDLMWISDEALNAPLPSEWTEHHDSSDRVFYYNVRTHASSWTHPLEQLHRDTYKSIINFRSGRLSKEEQAQELEEMRRRCEDCEREAHRELQAWTEHVDEQGAKFFYNRELQRSVWTDPRPAQCHQLYLQMKAIRVLSKQSGHAVATRGPEQVFAELGRPLPGTPELQTKSPQHAAPLKMPKSNSAAQLKMPKSPRGASAEGDQATSAPAAEAGERAHKKKRRDRDRDHEAGDAGGIPELKAEPGSARRAASERPHGEGRGHGTHKEPLGAAGFLGGGADRGADLGDWAVQRQGWMDKKKPPMAAVEEVRAALGVSHGLSLQSDSLNNLGRTKIRAGIRLEPLQGGA